MKAIEMNSEISNSNNRMSRQKRGLAGSSEIDSSGAREHVKSVSKKFAERKPKKVDAGYLHRAALYYLQRFAASRAKLQDVLLRKVARRQNLKSVVVEEVRIWLPEIEKLMDRYEEVGLLNDAALADSRVAAMRRQGGSARNITQKLKQKGFAAATVAGAIEQHDAAEEITDEDALRIFMQKKRLGPYRRPEKTPDDKLIKKEIAALLRAGFAYELVKTAMHAEEFMAPE